MELLSDPHVYRLFRESNYEASVHNYNREAGARVLAAILSRAGLSPDDTLAVSRADDFVAVCTTGVGVGDEYGMFKKRVQLGDFVPWDRVASVAVTEPGLKVFGLEMRGGDGAVLFKQTWNSVSEGLPERDRLLDVITPMTSGTR